MRTGNVQKCAKSGQANIGENSFWCETLDEYNSELIYTQVHLFIKNKPVTIEVHDEKQNGHALALKIAETLESRLN